jgi:lipopolysaccharide biosynthesis glycosyltransferase
MANLPEGNQPIDFLIVSDSQNFNPVITLIYQLIELHVSHQTRIHLIVPNVEDEEYFRKLLCFFELEIKIYHFDLSKYSIPEHLFQEKNGVTKIAYSKIFAPKILPADINRIIYLDTDVLIVRPLTPLVEFNIESSLGATIDAKEGLVGDLNNAFNSGVMIMNLDKMRNNWDDLLLTKSFEKNINSHWMDMTILRDLYKNDWQELPTSYNFLINSRDQAYSAENQLALVHFAASPKPWQGGRDSVFFVLWIWLNRKTTQMLNDKKMISGQYRILLKDGYIILNEIYHQIQSSRSESPLEKLKAELAGAQAELAGAQAELAGAQAELAGAQAELAGILMSRTWRFFRFYRKLK